MYKRLKKLRNELEMTQQEFADVLGTARGNISAYEVGKNAPSDAVISLICKTDFPKGRVNETWLRTGEGEMFIEASRDEQIAAFVGGILKDEEDTFKKKFISMLAALDESDWESLQKMVELLRSCRTKVSNFPGIITIFVSRTADRGPLRRTKQTMRI